MGTQCKNGYPPPDPDTTNHCNDYDDLYDMTDFCTLAGLGGKSARKNWCGKLGSEGEWGVNAYGGNGGTCSYDSCKPYKVLGFGCCKGCCGITGSGVDCKRLKFKGNPIQCCLQDKVCNPQGAPVGHPDSPPSCYSDTTMKNTCSPCNRDVTTSDNSKGDSTKMTCKQAGEDSCQTLVSSYCSGADLTDPTDTSWMDRWYDPTTGIETPQSCIYALKRNLYSNLGCSANNINYVVGTGTCSQFPTTVTPSASGTVWSQELMAAVFAKYKENGFVIGALPGTDGYNPFQEFLYEICCSFPIICQQSLDDTCNIYTSQRLTGNPEIANWCGCYLPKAEYEHYVEDYQINQECTPMCNRPTTIPLVTGDGTPYKCTQTVCLIDDITIGLANSTVTDGINITQVCGNCGTGASCSCIVEDNTIEGADAYIGGGINISASCSSTQCTVTNPTGGDPPVLTIPCSEANDPNSAFNKQLAILEAQQAKAQRNTNIIRIVVIVVAIVIIIIAFLVIHPNLYPTKGEEGYVTIKGQGTEAPTMTKIESGTERSEVALTTVKGKRVTPGSQSMESVTRVPGTYRTGSVSFE